MSNPGTLTNSNTIVASSGTNTITVAVEFINNGVVEVIDGATETVAAPLVGGTGSLQIGTGGHLFVNAGSIQASQTIVFNDATGLLTIDTNTIAGFSAIISGFQAGDQITVLTSGVAATFSQSGSVVSVIANDITLGYLAFASVAQASLAISTSGALNGQVSRILDWIGAADTGFANAGNWNDLSNGLTVAASAPGTADTAQLLTTGGTITGTDTVASLEFGGTALWNVTSSATLTATSSIVVGQNGNGAVLVNGGAHVTSLGTLEVISGTSGGAAAVTVDGNASLWSSSGELIVGDLGAGNLSISNQGSVSAAASASHPALALGVGAAGNGGLTASGSGSQATLAGQLVVGASGLGSLSVTSGADVIVTAGSLGTPSGAVIADQSGSDGSLVNVSGAGSGLQIAGTLQIGNLAAGALNVTAGGQVSATALDAGIANNGTLAGTAQITLSGPGSSLTLTGGATLGDAGSASMAVLSGATVSAATFDLAKQSGSSGILSVTGKNSTLRTTGTLSVGDGSSGELSILSGANVQVGGDLDIGQGTGGSGNVDVESATGTLFIGGNLNMGAGGPAELTVGPGATVFLDNGNINATPNATLILFNSIDPVSQTGGVIQAKATQSQNFPGFVKGVGFAIANGVTYTLNTPQILTNNGTATTFSLGTTSELILNADTAQAGTTVTFSDNASSLVIGADQLSTINVSGTNVSNPNIGLPLVGGFQGTVAGFEAGDTIVVDTDLAATFTQTGTTISVVQNGTTIGSIAFDTLANATAASGTAGALVDNVVCFAAGTRIVTERGPVAVEKLREGDQVRLALGGTAPVQWIGRRQVNCTSHPNPQKVWPVRVAAGAFGPGAPARDLYLSPGHAVYVNQVLIPVRLLINGTSIAQVRRRSVSYYHLELPRHEVILAEGLACESYLDVDDRACFDNGGLPVMLHPDFARCRWELRWDAEGCAPLVLVGPELEAAKTIISAAAMVIEYRRKSFEGERTLADRSLGVRPVRCRRVSR